MNNEFVPYELALELKELGFDEPNYFLKWYDSKGKIREGLGLGEVKAPLYQQAFRWFREKYDIHYSINRECSQHYHKWGYNWSLYNYTGIFDEFLTSHPDAPAGEWVYETYEEAERECLKEIIKIINEKD